MIKNIPEPTLLRLVSIYDYLDNVEDDTAVITSKRLSDKLGISHDTIRKDINCLGGIGTTASGYNIKKLKDFLFIKLGLDIEIRLCVVGLGRIGKMLVNYEQFDSGGFKIIAGFDKSINKLETTNTKVDLYPVYDMEKIIIEKKINFAMLAVPAGAAQDIADRLAACGIKGILNFAPVFIKTKNREIHVHNIDFAGELRKILVRVNFKK